jgi:hypothetical protein
MFSNFNANSAAIEAVASLSIVALLMLIVQQVILI